MHLRSLIKSIEQFTSTTVTGTLDGKVHSFTFEFRDPWKWILLLIQDESLAPMNMWNSVRKYYCCSNHEERIYDEPNMADTWWDIDVSFFLPQYSLKFLIFFFISQNFLRRMISHIVICLFTFGLIKALLPDACLNIRWSCILHGSHARFKMDLETVVVFWLDICLW